MRLMLSRRAGIWPFLALAVVVATTALLVPRTPQPLSYHHFADQRSWLGVPNFGDVASNFLFFVAGKGGVGFFFCRPSPRAIFYPRRRFPRLFFFGRRLLPRFGSVLSYFC